MWRRGQECLPRQLLASDKAAALVIAKVYHHIKELLMELQQAENQCLSLIFLGIKQRKA